MASARFILQALLIASLASCAPRTEIDVARAMCIKNVLCLNSSEDVETCTERVSKLMVPASCSKDELVQCEADIDDEACTSPEARLPSSCFVCE